MQIAKTNDIRLVFEQYEEKKELIDAQANELREHVAKFQNTCSVVGEYGGYLKGLEADDYFHKEAKEILNKSAWKWVYKKLNIQHIAPQTHISKFEAFLEKPPEFTPQAVRSVFKQYWDNPRGMALKAFAEVFCTLDRAYKSHSNVRVGVSGLPKRVIVSGVNSFRYYGEQKVAEIINVLMRFRGQYHLCVNYHQVNSMLAYGKTAYDVLSRKDNEDFNKQLDKEPFKYQGLSFKVFKNGNCHVIFDKQACKEINLALAEYYGEVLPDAYEHTEKAKSTAVAKDLQFYKTPKAAAERLADFYIKEGSYVLEPSCGDGALLDVLPNNVNAEGVEIDKWRLSMARAKGYKVYHDNFLEFRAMREYDFIIMNPPFYGKHYLKHIEKAFSLLKECGVLRAILPVTARDDHGIIDKTYSNVRWEDLPIGSFAESGTNINTVILTLSK